MRFKTLIVIAVLFLIVSCQSSSSKSKEYFNQGLEHFEYNEYDAALVSFENCLEAEPDNFEAYYYRGNCFLNLADYSSAIEEFVKAIEINPNYAEAFANLGQAYFYSKNYKMACKYYQKAHDLGKPDMEDKLIHCN